jgi:hypothetical protein
MKARILCIVLLFASFACKDDEFTETPPVPEDIFHVELCPTLLTNVTALFPEARNNEERYGDLFAQTTQQRIVLTNDTDVYVSFVSEAATLGNVLGYYIYPSSSEPSSTENIDKQLVFPNLDNTLLAPGDSRQLGTAPLKAGTVIGFFLIVGGYKEDGVSFKRPTFYTDQALNSGSAKQHVLYRENECGSIVIGFEDKSSVDADKDYNDVIFTVSDNKDNVATTSFDVQNVVSLSR